MSSLLQVRTHIELDLDLTILAVLAVLGNGQGKASNALIPGGPGGP